MKHIRLSTGLLAALLLVSTASAQNLVIQWTVNGWPLGIGWLPKIASDGQNGNVAMIDQTAIGGDVTFNYFDGQMVISDINYLYWDGPYDITSSGQPNAETGHAPSIAMVDCVIAACTSYAGYTSDAIEVHQVGNDSSGAKLWFRTGVDTGYGTTWANAQSYDNGFNPTVAIDQSGGTATDTTVVEVHQATIDTSLLWYHIGKLTYTATSASASFDGSHSTGFTGYAPTVSVARGVVVLMAQAATGEMWYSIGSVNAAAGTITWGPQTTYDTGWNPSVSVQWCGVYGADFGCDFMVVEVHQQENGTGPLLYRTGAMYYGGGGTSIPTSIKWTPNADTKYATGCYPSVSVMTDYGGTSHPMVESHSDACGVPAQIFADWGSIQNEVP